MATPLPSITQQRKKSYRPSKKEVIKLYDLINKYVFKNKLTRPPITLGICRKYWGMCQGFEHYTRRGTMCRIHLSDKWYCVQWLITTLAHEMAHQYEWDILGRGLTHRRNFFIWRDALAKVHIDLKTYHKMRRWFKYQDFKKC